MFKKLRRDKGFTLAELLIVVAIIAVLAAIAIPIFSSQLDNAKAATDIANIRSAYAEAAVATLDSSGSGGPFTVTLKSNPSNWSEENKKIVIGKGEKTVYDWIKDLNKTQITVSVDPDGKLSIS